MRYRVLFSFLFFIFAIAVFGSDYVDPSEYMDPDEKNDSFSIWPLVAIGGVVYGISRLYNYFKEVDKRLTNFEKFIIVTCALSIILLGIGFFKVGYGYYVFLRFAIFLASLLCMTYELTRKINHHWKIYFLIILVVHNPIYPIHLQYKTIWLIIDFIFGMIFFSKITDLVDKAEDNDTQK